MTFYKYYNNECDIIQWLAIQSSEDFSGLIYMDDYIETEPDYSTLKRYSISKELYKSFMKSIIN